MRHVVLGCAIAIAPAWAAAAVSGMVFVDNDGNGEWSAGDVPVAGAAVWLDAGVRVKTDAGGNYVLPVSTAGTVWVSTPDQLAPYPAWRAVGAAGGTVNFPLVMNPATGPLRFVQGTDTHVGGISGDAAVKALAQAGTVLPPPYFLVLTGDITQGNSDGEFQAVLGALGGLPMPVVAVPGNHDYYDGGANYRRYLGPTTYSFDAGGTHFVVMESTDAGAMLPFLDKDLVDLLPGTQVVGFLHYPPAGPGDGAFLNGLKSRGVTRLFTGHLHRARTYDYGGVVDHSMSPMVMGGVDFTPGGWRVIDLDGLGDRPTIEYHTTVERPVFRVLQPLPDECVPAGAFELIAAVEVGGMPVSVGARLDGAETIPLTYAGGWAYTVSVDLSEGQHTVEMFGDQPGMESTTVAFCAEEREPVPVDGEWPQLQGGPTHLGATPVEVAAPLQTVWARAVGGHLRGGSPVLSAGRLFVPVVDPGDGRRGGVVALDARTGAVLWEARLGRSVHNAPAVEGDLVVVSAEDGVVYAFAAGTGAELWNVDLTPGQSQISTNLWAAPTIAGGKVYIGIVANFAAIDATTGEVLWHIDPAPAGHVDGTFSSVAAEGGRVVGMFGFGGVSGFTAYDAATGYRLWGTPSALGSAISPMIVDGKVYGGDGTSNVFAADLVTGTVAWQVKLVDDGGEWSYLLGATPAIAGGRMFVPTHAQKLYALDLVDGQRLWSIDADESVLHPVHYRAANRSFAASPVVTGGLLWVGGADGRLRAVDVAGGDVIWSVDLGSPILSGVVPASPYLFVSTWDGTVRAMASGGTLPPPPAPGGCSVGATAGLLLLGTGLWGALRRRKKALDSPGWAS